MVNWVTGGNRKVGHSIKWVTVNIIRSEMGYFAELHSEQIRKSSVILQRNQEEGSLCSYLDSPDQPLVS